jgi:hypothetical protein
MIKRIRGAISLLPLAVVALAWWHARSHSASAIFFGPGGWTQIASMQENRTMFYLSTVSAGRRRAWSVLLASARQQPEFELQMAAETVGQSSVSDYSTHLGFGFAESATPRLAEAPPGKCFLLVAPFWFWFIIGAIPPSRAAWRAQSRWRMKRSGRCLNCGYDLRASRHRCPECGTPFAPPSSLGSAL